MSRGLISVQEAREIVLESCRPLEPERVALAEALDRVLAEDLHAGQDMPPFAASAMDGYAVRSAPESTELRLIDESRAGTPASRPLAGGEAIRISTGAVIPDGADAVIRQEDVQELSPDLIRTLAGVAPGENVRPAGEVMRAGTRVLPRGTTLGPPELAAAIGAGGAAVMVTRSPQVRILGTGDELRDPGAPLGPGEIHDSNGLMLTALALRAGAAAHQAPRLPDDPAATEAGLEAALGEADVMVIAGGVSVGPHDHVKPALARLGVREHFWRVALQPGKPTWFGTREGKLVFGLPGNPVSAAVTFGLFVSPALTALQGASPATPSVSQAVLGTAIMRNPEREQALRVRLEELGGELVATPNGPQGSHVITSLVGADALALIPAGAGMLEPGAVVPLYPLPH
jgi:molybdopterin molybdotransferase